MNAFLIQEKTLKQYKPDPKTKIIKKTQQKEILKIQEQRHLDSIYYGQVNKSSYRQGFGILQTIDFHTYIGFFKNGKAQGIGLIIYQNGKIIYGNFIKDQLNGVGLIDDGKFLRLGVFNKLYLTGIAFEYQYQKFMWRMCKYHNGAAIQTLKEEVSHIDNKLPYIVSSQHSLYFHLLNYLQGKYFQNQKKDQQQSFKYSQTYIHPRQPNLVFFGKFQNEKQTGCGILYNKLLRVPIQIGFYLNGKLNGYCFKNVQAIKHQEFGYYNDGKKQGLFIHIDSDNKSYCMYQNNVFHHSSDYSSEYILKKKQKQYNYNQKSFISIKNTLNLSFYLNIFESSEIKEYKKKQTENISPSRQTLNKILQNGQQNRSREADKNSKSSSNGNKNYNMYQKSSVSIIREKLKEYSISNLNQQQYQEQGNEGKVFKRSFGKKNENQINKDVDDLIAQQQNPFSNININQKNESPKMT